MTKQPPKTKPPRVFGIGLLSVLLAGAMAIFATPAGAQAPAAPGVCAVTNAEAGAFVFWEAVDNATEYVYGAQYNNGPQRFGRTGESSIFIDAEQGRVTSMRVAAIAGGVTSNATDCSIDGQGGQPPVTQPPVTQPPVTQPPVTQPPVTQPPVTEPPVTQPPVTEPPVTEPPADEPPVVEPPAEEPAAEEEPAEPEMPDDEADNDEDPDEDSDSDEADDDDGRRGNNGNRCNAAERGRSGANDNMGNRCNAERRGNSANANRPTNQANNGNRCNEQQRGNSGNNANNSNRCNVEERGNSAQAAREGLARSGRPCHAVAGGNGVGIAWNPMAEAAEYVFAYRVNGLTRYDRANANSAVIQGLPEGAQVALRVGSVRADGSYGAAVDCGEVEAPAEAAE